MSRRHGRLQLWDWERFETGVPLGLDRCHYGVNAVCRRDGVGLASVMRGLELAGIANDRSSERPRWSARPTLRSSPAATWPAPSSSSATRSPPASPTAARSCSTRCARGSGYLRVRAMAERHPVRRLTRLVRERAPHRLVLWLRTSIAPVGHADLTAAAAARLPHRGRAACGHHDALPRPRGAPAVARPTVNKGIAYFDLAQRPRPAVVPRPLPAALAGASPARSGRGHLREQRLLPVPPARSRADRPGAPRRQGRGDGPGARRACLLGAPARVGPGIRVRALRGGPRARARAHRRGGGADHRRPDVRELPPPPPRLSRQEPLLRADRAVHRRARARARPHRRRRRVLRRPGRRVRAAAFLARAAGLAAGEGRAVERPAAQPDAGGAARAAGALLRAVRRQAGRADGPDPELAGRQPERTEVSRATTRAPARPSSCGQNRRTNAS